MWQMWRMERIREILSQVGKTTTVLIINGIALKIVPNCLKHFWTNRQYKFSETAFLTKSVRNGVRHLARNANSDPMVKISSKSDKWRRKIRISAKIRKIPKFPYYNLRNSINLTCCFKGISQKIVRQKPVFRRIP